MQASAVPCFFLSNGCPSWMEAHLTGKTVARRSCCLCHINFSHFWGVMKQEVWFYSHLRCNPCRPVSNQWSLLLAPRQAVSLQKTALDGAVTPAQPPRRPGWPASSPSQGQAPHSSPKSISVTAIPYREAALESQSGEKGLSQPCLAAGLLQRAEPFAG